MRSMPPDWPGSGWARYKFKLAGKDFTAKVTLFNIFDVLGFVPVGNGVYNTNSRRNVQAYLATEF